MTSPAETQAPGQENLLLEEKQAPSGHPFAKNWEALDLLRKESADLLSNCGISMGAMLAGSYLTNPLVIGTGIVSGALFQWRAAKVARLIEVVKLLLETFEAKGMEIEVYPRIPVEGMNPLDLFIRFPKKTHLFIAIRSKGDKSVVYNENREILQTRRRKGQSFAVWAPNPLIELADQENWVIKNRLLFGMTSKESSKAPSAKILALWPPTTVGVHKDHLYTEIGDLKPLVVRRKGAVFIIEKGDLISFIWAWLASKNCL